MMPKVVKMVGKWPGRPPRGAIRIDRRTKWGNPYIEGKHGDHAAVIAKHEAWLRTKPDLLRDLDELRGKDLACWCAPEPCHGDLLLRLANATPEERLAWLAESTPKT
jgi:hypothetical protein